MEELVIDNRLIKADLITILNDIRMQLTNGKLSQFHVSGSNIQVTCPFHADGRERRPSCFISLGNSNAPYGWYHCFTCGSIGPFEKFVGECFDRSQSWGARWLIEHYAEDVEDDQNPLYIKEIKLDYNVKQADHFLDESILNKFVDYHPYMRTRKLDEDICKKFDVKYDKKTRCLVFPVRDIKGRLKYLTRRSVDSKKFIIDKNANKKDVYLLNECLNELEVCVCESQINALTLWGWGIPAIALLGAGTTKEQLEELNKTNIIHYILCYDPDDAGKKGVDRFKKYIRDGVFVDVLNIPKGKDVNDLTKEEFLNIKNGGLWDIQS